MVIPLLALVISLHSIGFVAISVEFTRSVVGVGCKGNWGTSRSENKVREEMRGAHVASATREAHAGMPTVIADVDFLVDNATVYLGFLSGSVLLSLCVIGF